MPAIRGLPQGGMPIADSQLRRSFLINVCFCRKCLPMYASTTSIARRLTLLTRILLSLAIGGLSFGFLFAFASAETRLSRYLLENDAAPSVRSALLHWILGSVVAFTAAGVVLLVVSRFERQALERSQQMIRRASPLALVGFFPIVTNWTVWQTSELAFHFLVALLCVTTWQCLRIRERTACLAWEQRLGQSLRLMRGAFVAAYPRLATHFPLTIVVLAAAGYSLYFSYYTVIFHQAARTGFDLAIENNLMWNLLHGSKPLFKSSPIFGPDGTHFGNHATLFAFVMLPIYALNPRPETLLAIQSCLLGFSAIPLFLFGKRIAGSHVACLVVLAYLLYPALHGANIFEFHYIPLGIFFLFSCFALLEARRYVWAAVASVLTLLVREDVSAWVAVMGAYFMLSGKRPIAGLCLAAVGVSYFAVMKFFVMPQFAVGGEESFTFIFEKLIPKDGKGFGSVLSTVIGNPAYTLSTFLVPEKLNFLLALFLPVAFIPFRNGFWKLLFLPGILFTILSTGYGATVSIHFHYAAHWIAFLFPATLLAFAEMRKRRVSMGRTVAPYFTMGIATLAMTYQFGSRLQRNTSFGGPLRFTFGFDDDALKRRDAVLAIKQQLPENAKVSCSGFLVTQLSSRADAYSLTQGLYDAEYVAFPSVAGDFIVDEKTTVTTLLRNGTFGLVAVHSPFALARRGADTSRNEEFLRSLL